MRPLFEEVTDLEQGAAALRAHSHGVIEVVEERFVRVALRPYGRRISLLETLTLGRWQHARAGNWCRLYYSQARGCPGFLALQYVVSGRDATLATFRGALVLLDEIARIRAADALVCDVGNARISDRLLARWGWQPHCQRRWHRHFIKRFYGEHPSADPLLATMLATHPQGPTSAVPCGT